MYGRKRERARRTLVRKVLSACFDVPDGGVLGRECVVYASDTAAGGPGERASEADDMGSVSMSESDMETRGIAE